VEGRLCAVYSPIAGSATAYVYDAEGNRVAKGSLAIWPSSCPAPAAITLTNSYVLDLGGRQFAELGNSGNSLHTNVYAAGRLLATLELHQRLHSRPRRRAGHRDEHGRRHREGHGRHHGRQRDQRARLAAYQRLRSGQAAGHL
jgi:hypothetical protein